ncbi:unnamed protein product [Acanthoscelides obtectus]|uniref:Uncharacterized protein n=1 Tax=Acanthoscelides obtectus TaxID=200917 RepID=A0A9P0LLD2_ACAOB|nr:unnamed protein product [Acanthoscelides obtectus]CAK1658994.1 hypothetical protein AOBTE_LOCUS21241 [Acanthoscelides obtectus]
MQEQRRMRNQQEEPHCVQSLPTEEMLVGRHVQERKSIRQTVKLVQNPLLAAGKVAATATANRIGYWTASSSAACWVNQAPSISQPALCNAYHDRTYVP